MMRKILLILLTAVATALGAETNAPPQLIVNLTDGSRLVGTTELPAMVVVSESLGRITIPLAKIRQVKVAGKELTATLVNGDRLQGTLGVEAVTLQSLVGRVTIPFNVLRDLAVCAAPTEAGLREGLVAYYPFLGDAKDYSGNDNHGKVVGADFATVGIEFRGTTGSYVKVPRADVLEPANGITVAMWLKGVPGQPAGGGWGTIVRKAGPCGPGYGFRGGGISNFNLEGANPCGGTCKSTAFRAFDESRWQHVVGTYSAADGVVKTYQDGEVVNQTPLTGALPHSGDLFLGGANVAGDDGGFRGTMAEVRIYNRALAGSEIRALAAKPPASQ
jgi:hypothetical protein